MDVKSLQPVPSETGEVLTSNEARFLVLAASVAAVQEGPGWLKDIVLASAVGFGAWRLYQALAH
jgi:hypothetical protein